MDSPAAPTIFLVDDSIPVRERLAELVALGGPVSIVGEAGSVALAIRGIAATQPRVVVLDYLLEGGTGLDVLRALRGTTTAEFVVLTNHASPRLRAACLAAGAHHFLDKSTELAGLVRIVSEAHAVRARPTCEIPAYEVHDEETR